MPRKQALVIGEVYHVMNKSIAGFKIFNTEKDYRRMLQAIEYFTIADSLPKFSYFLTRARESGKTFEQYLEQCFPKPKRRVKLIAYCLMPTHLHLILKPLKNNGATHFMHDTFSSYSHFFNIKHKRKGPLWVDRFKAVRVESDEQLSHLTRYLHLNPVTAYLVQKPENWQFSSYEEYIAPARVSRQLCQYNDILDIKPRRYQKFVEDQIDYQRQLAKIKDLLLE